MNVDHANIKTPPKIGRQLLRPVLWEKGNFPPNVDHSNVNEVDAGILERHTMKIIILGDPQRELSETSLDMAKKILDQAEQVDCFGTKDSRENENSPFDIGEKARHLNKYKFMEMRI